MSLYLGSNIVCVQYKVDHASNGVGSISSGGASRHCLNITYRAFWKGAYIRDAPAISGWYSTTIQKYK